MNFSGTKSVLNAPASAVHTRFQFCTQLLQAKRVINATLREPPRLGAPGTATSLKLQKPGQSYTQLFTVGILPLLPS